MYFRPYPRISDKQLQSGLQWVIADGMAAEAMTCFTSGTFLVAIALYLGATNVQVGMLAALPVCSNVFQLVTIWMMQRFRSRRGIVIIASILARLPLLLIAALPLLVQQGHGLQVLIVVLLFHYFFGAMAGAGWNAWMKDLVPSHALGNYFAHRTRLTQLLNVTLCLALAVALDHIRAVYPGAEIKTYAWMFLAGGVVGLAGIYALYKTPEPKQALPEKTPVLQLVTRPLLARNFRRLILFNGCWTFAINLATPFFTVYMIKTLQLPLTSIIAIGIAGQVAGILFVKPLGKYADAYSNKTILLCFAPLYAVCICAWAFAGAMHSPQTTLVFLLVLHIIAGIATAGINLALNNIGIKLSPPAQSASYLATKNICIALFATAGPLAGGLLADQLAGSSLRLGFDWNNGPGHVYINLLHLEQWSFFFVLAPIVALCSLRLLKGLKEEGEVHKVIFMADVKKQWKNSLASDKLLRRTALRINDRGMMDSIKHRINEVFLYRLPDKTG